ncbi:MAG: GNAT family N-acetyltransferase [Burkholderiales bacterium]|nr:GNAT family N-acetyltransferase [Burkholderiales bacterium]
MNRGFRPASADDIAAVAALQAGYYAADGYAFDAARARRALAGLIAEPRLGALWVAERGGAVVGYLAVTLGYSLEYGGRDAFVDELYVAEGARGLGLGRDALRLAETWCRDAGVRALHLEVEPHRAAALALYRRGGFEVHGRHLMTKRLDAE